MHLPDDIWLRTLRDESDRSSERIALLSRAELRRYESFSHDDRRRSFLLGRAAARTLAAEQLGIPASDVNLEVAADGSVYLPGEELRVSISHSGTLGAAVLARRPVGLDVERIRTPHPRLRDRILSERERDDAVRLPIPSDETTLLYWTLKEAVLKGRRTGLRQSTRSVELSIDYQERRATANLDDGAEWEAVFGASDGYLMSIAYEIR